VTSTDSGRGLERSRVTREISGEATAAVEPDVSALAEELMTAARTSGVELTGPGGLLTGLTKQETAWRWN
jgi:putative transposase